MICHSAGRGSPTKEFSLNDTKMLGSHSCYYMRYLFLFISFVTYLKLYDYMFISLRGGVRVITLSYCSVINISNDYVQCTVVI